MNICERVWWYDHLMSEKENMSYLLPKEVFILLDVGIRFCCWCHTFHIVVVLIFMSRKMLTREMKRKEQSFSYFFCSFCYYRHVESIKFSSSLLFQAIWTVLFGLYSFVLTFYIKMGIGILLFRPKLNGIMEFW